MNPDTNRFEALKELVGDLPAQRSAFVYQNKITLW
jgi:hypothetical protein